MGDEGRAAPSDRVALASTAGAPFVFEVGIAGADPGRASRAFAVAGPDPATGAGKTREYRLPDTQHNARRHPTRQIGSTAVDDQVPGAAHQVGQPPHRLGLEAEPFVSKAIRLDVGPPRRDGHALHQRPRTHGDRDDHVRLTDHQFDGHVSTQLRQQGPIHYDAARCVILPGRGPSQAAIEAALACCSIRATPVGAQRSGPGSRECRETHQSRSMRSRARERVVLSPARVRVRATTRSISPRLAAFPDLLKCAIPALGEMRMALGKGDHEDGDRAR